MSNKFIINTFIELTSMTVPYGYEDEFFNNYMKKFLPDNVEKDAYGNFFIEIGESRTIFASHIDTVSSRYVGVKHEIEGNFIKTDGKTTLGADDKAGVTVMLWMIKNKVPGLYYFFMGEEVGCVGSGMVAKYESKKMSDYDRIISFDRRGTNSVITNQSCRTCCSDSFADDLCDELNKNGLSYQKDTGGVYTDSAEFMDIIPECTNISVGYYSEHTMNEKQDIKHLIELADACLKVNWESLTTERDPNKKSYTRTSYPSNYKTYCDSEDWYEEDFEIPKGVWSRKNKKTRRSKKRGRVYFDSGSDLVDVTKTFTPSDMVSKYDWIIEKFVDDDFSIEDLHIVRDCYLNMDSDYDVYFYNYLYENIAFVS